jgi:hypothetical protein
LCIAAPGAGQFAPRTRAAPPGNRGLDAWHGRCDLGIGMNAIPEPRAASAVCPGYHGAVCDFKRRLIEATLHQMRGNRTHTARALGLQRTYLLRLIRDLGVAAPPPPPRGRSAAG